MEPIENHLLDTWRLLSFKTTQKEISEATGLSTITIRFALKHGIATQATIEKLTEFFNNLKSLITA